jgi:hypothetical protein
MRDNPDNDTLGNLVGREADHTSDPETPPQSEIARNPNHTNVKEATKRVGDVVREKERQSDHTARNERRSDHTAQKTHQSDHTAQSDHIARNLDPTNINEAIDKRVGDVEGENDSQLGDEDDEERISNVNMPTEQGQQRQPLGRSHRLTLPTWKTRENQLIAKERSEFPTTIDLIMLNLTNATEQLQAPQSISEILRRRNKDLWLELMHRELRALLRNKTWEYVRRSDVPAGHKVLTGR